MRHRAGCLISEQTDGKGRHPKEDEEELTEIAQGPACDAVRQLQADDVDHVDHAQPCGEPVGPSSKRYRIQG